GGFEKLVRIAAIAGIGLGTQDAFAFIMQRVVEAGEHANGIAKRRVRRYILDPFAVNPDFAAVPQALHVFFTGERLGSRGGGRLGSLGLFVGQPAILPWSSYAETAAYCAQSRSKRNTSLAGGKGACVSIQRTGSAPRLAKLWMQPTLVQITSPGPRSYVFPSAVARTRPPTIRYDSSNVWSCVSILAPGMYWIKNSD